MLDYYSSFAPRYAANCAEAPRLINDEKADTCFAELHPLRILVAEDNYINRQLLVAMLKALGYEPFACENGTESFTAALLGDFDVMFDDLDMSELNGAECACKLREAGVSLTIIALTSSSPQLSRNECIDAGMEGYLMRPLSLEDIKRVLAAAHATRVRHDLLNCVA